MIEPIDWQKQSQSYKRGWVEASHGGPDGRNSLLLYETCTDISEYERGRAERLAEEDREKKGGAK